ncbi:hypothetical protein V8G54_037370 [Vigna mungo]|uniref:Tf2-1-like SH3-like domain-containing protein n=1 Tax=Vigna mungo TaxID=3915 RepID=A0AAQ3RFB6_VIGMU
MEVPKWCFNTTKNTSTDFIPFEVMFGHPPSSIPHLLNIDTSNCTIQFEISSRDVILQKMHSNLKKAQDTIKRWADLHHRDLQFSSGDWVYVRLCPRRQHSVTGPYLGKLQKRVFGPFKILETISEVAYKLDLPASAQIHNVFHVSLLRPHHEPTPSPPPLNLPLEIVDNQPVLIPATILD